MQALWDWVWANVQSLWSFIELIAFVSLGVFTWWKWFRKKPEEITHTTSVEPRPLLTFEKAYLDELDSRCEFLRLDLIAKPVLDRGLRLSLSHIYQDQHIRLAEREQEGREHALQKGEPLPLMQALAKLDANHLVIRGGVGAGKSSFVNYLTHCIIQSHQGDVGNDLPPQFIRRPVVRLLLRKVGARLNAQTAYRGLIWRAVAEEIEELVAVAFDSANQTPLQNGEINAFVQQYIAQLKQQGIVLLDGLDEVSESSQRRGLLRKAIEDFASTSPNTLLIVTGRPYAYERQEQKLTGFRQADLEPMTENQIRAFISHWYKVARKPNGWTEQQAQTRADQLAEEIFARPYLPEMASTAMLLTLFIGLDYADIRLPSSRAKLYDEAVELLLQRWHQNLKDYRDNLDPAEQEGLLVLERSRDELLKALKSLAYKTYQDLAPSPRQAGEEATDIPLEFDHATVIGHLYKPFGQSCDHDNLLYFLQYRSALLVAGSEEESFQFAHRSFHEYLAASHLMSLPRWKEEAEKLLKQNSDWWREVFLLLVKKYSDDQPGEAVQFLQHLMRYYKASDVVQQRLLVLVATAALELNVQDKLDEDVLYVNCHQFLQDGLISALTDTRLDITERADAGRLLGELGDPRPGITVIREGEYKGLPDIGWESIPAGTLQMGFTDEEAQQSWEKTSTPQHVVALPAFQMSRYPITNAQFACFVAAGGYETERYWHSCEAAYQWWKGEKADLSLLDDNPDLKKNYENWLAEEKTRRQPWFWEQRKWNNPNHPVVGVSWYEALAFCEWLNTTSVYQGKQVRLPMEAEWEYAARGTQGLRYAWGEEADAVSGNYGDTKIGQTSAVGMFPAGKAFGLYDMTGNVWEWTSSQWGKKVGSPDFTYDQWAVQEKQRDNLNEHALRIIRGGSWLDTTDNVRCAFRFRNHPVIRGSDLGFRLVLGE